MMEYKFVSEERGSDLEETVNRLIEQGWVPCGGVSVSVCHRTRENKRKGYEESETEWVYAQAMIRLRA